MNGTNSNVTNQFDDYLTVSYRVDGVWRFHIWSITTDPGRTYMLKPMNGLGTAILMPNQYLGTYVIGLHQGKYEALCQYKPVVVYRDKNGDLKYDMTRPDRGVFGINIHKAGTASSIIENWSAGCQVFKKAADFNEFMNICRKSRAISGNSFTYTLLDIKDFS
jgi:hypothetical protein